MKWNELEIDGIATIRKLVGEFKIKELYLTSYTSFKVRIYEHRNGQYIGFTSLQLKEDKEDKCPYCGVGHGESISLALIDTINNFVWMFQDRYELKDDDFELADPYDF